MMQTYGQILIILPTFIRLATPIMLFSHVEMLGLNDHSGSFACLVAERVYHFL